MSREQRRTRQQDLGRAQLLDAAEDVFGRRGYHDATLKEVAELAEFSVGSVYSFFENKDDLFLHVFLRRGQAFLDGMREVVTATAPALDRLRDLVAFEVAFFRDHPNFGRLYLRTSSVGSPLPGTAVDDATSRGLEAAMALQGAVFAAGQAEGTVRAGPPDVLAQLLRGVVTSYLAVDPSVVGPGPTPVEPLPLAALQEIVQEMFRP